ncbi:unnamed protein product, partial [Symbiodinium pilosum]
VLKNSQKYDVDKPVIVFLGEERWLPQLQELDLPYRKPFVVKTGITPGLSGCDAQLMPSCDGKEVEELMTRVLEQWNGRLAGEGQAK